MARKRHAPTKRRVKPTDSGEITSQAILLDVAARVGEAEVRKAIDQADEIRAKVAGAGPLQRFLDDVNTMIALLRDFASGDYRTVPFGTIAAVTGALLYVLLPVDLIPDFIPGVGYMDDAGVIGACLQLVARDLTTYRAWKAA